MMCLVHVAFVGLHQMPVDVKVGMSNCKSSVLQKAHAGSAVVLQTHLMNGGAEPTKPLCAEAAMYRGEPWKT